MSALWLYMGSVTVCQFYFIFCLAKFAGNTRVVNQKELEFFREELQNRMSSSYNVILKERKLPLSLLNDRQKVCGLFLIMRCLTLY